MNHHHQPRIKAKFLSNSIFCDSNRILAYFSIVRIHQYYTYNFEWFRTWNKFKIMHKMNSNKKIKINTNENKFTIGTATIIMCKDKYFCNLHFYWYCTKYDCRWFKHWCYSRKRNGICGTRTWFTIRHPYLQREQKLELKCIK